MNVTTRLAPLDGPALNGLASHPLGSMLCAVASGILNARLVRASPYVPTSFSWAEADRMKTNVMEAAMTNVLGSMASSLAAPVMNGCLSFEQRLPHEIC